MRPLGIMAAVHGEVAGVLCRMGPDVQVRRIGMRDYHVGLLDGQPCVVVLARIGKVAASATAVTLIREFHVRAIAFFGLAGGVGKGVRVGDIVLADRLLQHDLDASPLFPRHQVPLLERSHFSSDAKLLDVLAHCARDYLNTSFRTEVGDAVRSRFGMNRPSVHIGLVASGDQFLAQEVLVNALLERIPEVQCVEMEGAAVAQICHEYEVPYVVARTISDRADNTAAADFNGFLEQVAGFYGTGLITRFVAASARY